MRSLTLHQQRKIFCWACGVITVAVVAWWLSPGLPVIWGPSARASEIEKGRELFEHEWTPNDPLAKGDGLGPVYNAKSCAACHFQGGLGGGGGAAHNAMTFELHPRRADEDFRSGVVHNFSIHGVPRETINALRKQHPIVKGSVIGLPGCQTVIPDFDPVLTESVNATALFGAGWIDLISDRAIIKNQRDRRLQAVIKEFDLDFGSIPTGRIPTTEDGEIGKFGWKGQSATLSDFVAAACAGELGLGTPKRAQAVPVLQPDLEEKTPDLDAKQFRSLVAFVKTLPRPVEVIPEDTYGREQAEKGKKLFSTVGCAACHVPDLGGVKGVYSDLLLYVLEDPTSKGDGYSKDPPKQLNLPERPVNAIRPEEWRTPPLWGVADSAPYFHDGAAPTLEAAITRHRGDARAVTAAYEKLSLDEKASLVAFLKTLKAPPEARPLADPSVTKLKP